MRNFKDIDTEKLWDEAESIYNALGHIRVHGFFERDLTEIIERFLQLVLRPEELEMLKLFRDNPELMDFIIKNKDMLKSVRKIGGILRVP